MSKFDELFSLPSEKRPKSKVRVKTPPEKPLTVVKNKKVDPKVEKIRLVKESDLSQLIIDINKGKIDVPDYVQHFFQNNTTDRGPFRGKRSYKSGGRIDGTLKQIINAIVDSEQLYIKKRSD